MVRRKVLWAATVLLSLQVAVNAEPEEISGVARREASFAPLQLQFPFQNWIGIKMLKPLSQDPDAEMEMEAEEDGAFVSEADPAITAANSRIQPLVAATLSTKFDAIRGSGLEPPDPFLAVGPTNMMVATNYGLQVYSKTGAKVGGLLGLNGFFGVPSSYNLVSDPKFVYDSVAGRFYGVLIGYSNSLAKGAWFVATSSTNSASGTWSTIRIEEANKLPDYPGLGFCSDKVVLTANNFNGAGTSYLGTVAVAINKAQLNGGGTVSFTIFGSTGGLKTSTGAQIFTAQPVKSLSTTSTCHIVSVNGTTAAKAQLYRMTGVPGVGSGAVLTTGSNLAINAISTTVGAKQQGSTRLLAAGDNRTLDASYRSGVLWTTFNSGCTFTGSTIKYDCARVLRIGGVDATPAIQLDGSYGGSGFYYTYPALSTDSSGNMTVIFTRSSSTEYAGLRFGGVRGTTTTLEPSVPLIAGSAAYTGTRWGDYFGAAYDGSDNSIWLVGEYKPSGTGLWGTYVGKTKF